MKIRIATIASTIVVLMGFCSTSAMNHRDDLQLKIGQRAPDIRLKLRYFNEGEISLSNFKGNWIVLDFFSRGCATCFESFPKINRMQKEYGDKVQFILIGKDDMTTMQMYERQMQRQNLQLTVTYDTVLFKAFDIRYVPYIIVIDPDFIIRAITTSLSKENMEEFLKGNEPSLSKALTATEAEERAKRYDFKKPLLIGGNGGNDTDFLYRSILTSWNGDIAAPNQDCINILRYENRVQAVCVDLKYLYNLAYGDTLPYGSYRGSSYGKLWRDPILEVIDSSDFTISEASINNQYNYSLIIPKSKATAPYLQEVMQRDLLSYFGYDVKVEKRMMPCWKLIVASPDLVKQISAKGNEPSQSYFTKDGFFLSNSPVSVLIDELFGSHQSAPPFIDYTEINGNIDLHVDAVFNDLDDVKNGLRKRGLDLTAGLKEMDVIVIKDKPKR